MTIAPIDHNLLPSTPDRNMLYLQRSYRLRHQSDLVQSVPISRVRCHYGLYEEQEALPPVSSTQLLNKPSEEFNLVPEETVASAASRFEAHSVRRMDSQTDYEDVDIPIYYSGANW